MKFLALNTAGPKLEVAVYDGERTFFRTYADCRLSSAVLMPTVDELLAKAGLGLSALDFVACVVGPGSFTGIRIGASAVRAMCYALKLPALSVNYLHELSYNVNADGCERVLCVTDASNGNSYVAEFDGDRKFIRECRAVPTAEAFAMAKNYRGTVCVDEKCAELILEAIRPDDKCESLVRAVMSTASDAGDHKALLPLYVRESQAEKDLREKNADG